MPNWNQVLEEIKLHQGEAALDIVRRRYLAQLYEITGRNVIAYYSGWLQKPGLAKTSVDDDDKNALMAVVHGINRSKGLDLILHTPGGDIAATESIVDYLRKMFGCDIRAIVPQLAMSAGTMIACASKEIVMGKQSSLGPIDPQFSGIPCSGVIEEFNTALEAIKKDPQTIPIWQVIINKYHPTFIGECQKAITWASEVVTNWLQEGMFKGDSEAINKATTIVRHLTDHGERKTHSRHIPLDECEKIGLKIKSLESCNNLQDTVLTIHHAFMHTLARSPSMVKIVENHAGQAMVFHQDARSD